MSNGSGGAATNAGIDFQQRIAALIMAHILTDMKSYAILQLNDELDVQEVRFETNDNVDDLVLITTAGRAFIQAKRTLSLSDKVDSEYSSVLKQFVAQYVDDNANSDKYILATSPRSSERITKELRKLTEAARFNEAGSSNNPLTKAEEEVLGKTWTLIHAHYLAKVGVAISEQDLTSLFKRIRVALLDVEAGAPLEGVVLTLLASKSNVAPQLLWNSLIALCVSLAKDRLSIDKSGLLERMGPFMSSVCAGNVLKAAGEFLRLHCQGSLSAGREVLLVKSFLEDADYIIVELRRFDNDGGKRLKFYDDKVQLLNGSTWDVVHRASTFAGIERFVIKNANQFPNARVAIALINTEKDLEDEPHAKTYSEYCGHLAESLENPLLCPHCGDIISEDYSPIIEVDEEHSKHCVGLVHESCLRSIDRVLGVIDSDLFRENRILKNFDYNLWLLKAPRGQGLFGTMPPMTTQILTIAWTPDYNDVSKGGWCIKISLEDGSARYMTERGRIVRCSEDQAVKLAKQFSEKFETTRSNGDPWCYTTGNEVFTIYSNALRIVADVENCLLCVKAEAAKYTQSIGSGYSRFDNFYAPLAFLIDKGTGLPIVINGAVFLISNPFRLERYAENWRRAGLDLPEFMVSTIESDDKFDKFVRQIKDDGLAVIINPMLNMNSMLCSGFVVENYYDLVGGETKAP